MKAELCRVRKPIREYTFSSTIWFPKNWIIRRHPPKNTNASPTIIPNVITDSPPLQLLDKSGVRIHHTMTII